MERKKKDVQEVIKEYWIHLNASNQMILIHSNVSKFLKNNTPTYCTVLQTDIVWMRAVTVWMKSFF